MPLIKSLDKKAISKNIETEMHAGKPQKQAIAIAYNVKKASGGIVDNSKMIDSLMAKRRKKLEANDDANTSPDLRESSSSLSNSTLFDDLDGTEQGRPDAEEAYYAVGGEVDSDEDSGNGHVSNKNIQMQQPPEPSLAPSVPHFGQKKQDDMRKSYDKGRLANYAAGGTVKKPIAYNSGLREDEGIAEDMSHDESTTYKADGGPILPGAESAQDSLRKAFGHAEGGKVNPRIPQARSYVQYGDDMHDADGNDIPHHDSLPQGSGKEDAFYKPKAIGNQGRQTIDLNMYANGGRVPMAYGQGRKEYDEGEQPVLPDENSGIAMAEGGAVPNLKENYAKTGNSNNSNKFSRGSGMHVNDQNDTAIDEADSNGTAYGKPGDTDRKYAAGGTVKKPIAGLKNATEDEGVDESMSHDESTTAVPRDARGYAKGGPVAYNSGIHEAYQDDTALDPDENSSIAYAKGGPVAYNSDIHEAYQDDTALDPDENSSIAYASGGSVDDERHLDADYDDTAESKDESSEIAMHDGGGVPYDASKKQKAKSPISIHDPLDHSGPDQSGDHNPKSGEEEDPKKSKRRKLMIQSLNE